VSVRPENIKRHGEERKSPACAGHPIRSSGLATITDHLCAAGNRTPNGGFIRHALETAFKTA